jgi:hypothetical protein
MFELPHTTIVNRAVPKNSFDAHISPKQKKLLSTHIDKIRWSHKLSKQTIKLEGKEVQEIQIFNVLLKEIDAIEDVMTIIDRCIPYHLLFVLNYKEEILFSTSQKHLHPTVDNMSVIDWRFKSAWINSETNPFQLVLKSSLDDIYSDFCFQLLGKIKTESLIKHVELEQAKAQLLKEIEKLESAIKRCKQFNIKVELNLQLQEKKRVLNELNNTL